MPEQNQLRELLKSLQLKAEALKRENPTEYKRVLKELVAALETYNQELKSALPK